MTLKYPVIRGIVTSPYMDVFAALLILTISLIKKFQYTFYFGGEVHFLTNVDEVQSAIFDGAYPLGIMSIIGAVFSMLSTRLVGKQKNSGNLIGIATTINSGVNDYLFRNPSALLTYPITFIVHSIASYKWAKGQKIKKIDKYYYYIVAIAMMVAFSLVFLGFYLFGEIEENITFISIIAISFGLSLGATVSNIFKYQETWLNWTIYNTFQLIKNAMQLNLPNVVKYVFYLFNGTITWIDWKFNGDVESIKNIA